MGKFISILLLCVFSFSNAELRSIYDKSTNIRRAPPRLLQTIGPLAFGVTDGDNAKFDLPRMGKFGMGDVTKTVVKFTPEGSENQEANGGTFEKEMRPGLGYMDRETTAGNAKESNTKMKIAGLGTIDLGEGKEQGTGLLDFSKSLFPFLKLPELKTDETEDFSNTNVDPRLGEIYYPKPISYLSGSSRQSVVEQIESEEQSVDDEREGGNPFDSIRLRGRSKAYGAKMEKLDDEEEEEGFIAQKGKVEEQLPNEVQLLSSEPINRNELKRQIEQMSHSVPIGKLGLSEKEIFSLCAKFVPIAAQHCYVHKIDPKFIDKCRGYNADCAEYIKKTRPLGAIANSFSSGVGMTFYDWQINGIPYYIANEQGGIGNGHHGKVDFGSWGGGYSDNLGVRDYWSQTQEYGANWYDGVYGYKTGWNVPIAQSIGIEGSQATQLNIPLKEGDIGKPISVTNGYNVGPYIGLADRVGVDWLNGGLSFNKGFSVPLIGVGVTSGTGIGFPSIGTMMHRMGLDPVETVNAVAQSLAATSL